MIAGVTHSVSGQPALKGSQVQLKRFKARWYGFAASATSMNPALAYSPVARTKTGWRCEMAGLEQVLDWEQVARRVLDLKTGNASIMYNGKKGTARVAIHHGTRLVGLFFASSRPVDLARGLAISQISGNQAALKVLAGIPADDQPDPGPIVCACHDVGSNTIQSAIRAGARTKVALGKCTAAGTNCGSCKPELQSLIDAAPL